MKYKFSLLSSIDSVDKRKVYCSGVDVVRVDQQGARAERLRGAGELGEHQHALGVLGGLAGEVLEGDEVHA